RDAAVQLLSKRPPYSADRAQVQSEACARPAFHLTPAFYGNTAPMFRPCCVSRFAANRVDVVHAPSSNLLWRGRLPRVVYRSRTHRGSKLGEPEPPHLAHTIS